MKEVLSVILGGGRGTRLYPLTKDRAKPAVPLAGKYRLIDVPISNCLNSGIWKIFILTQFNSESLNRHIFRSYKLDYFSHGYVEIIAAEQSREHADWFQGSADAVRKCLKHFSDVHTKYILILSGDQLYKMDFMHMLDFHIKNDSQITIACNPVGAEDVYEVGIMEMEDNYRVKSFVEKPKDCNAISHLSINTAGKNEFLASMGIYIFNKDVLSELLTSDKKADFGKEVIPEAIKRKKAYAFVHRGYWKDIGSIKSFYEENLAFSEDVPPLDLFDEEWQFFTRPRYLPLSKFRSSHIEHSNITEGAIINKAKIIHSIVGLRSKIGENSVVEDSVLMGNDFYEGAEDISMNKIPLGIGSNCHIKRAIIDKNVRIDDGVKIINKQNLNEFENEYCVIRNGICIIPKNTCIPKGTII